jgi:hypothetical protein
MHKQENIMHDQETQQIHSSAAVYPPGSPRVRKKRYLIDDKDLSGPDAAVAHPKELGVRLPQTLQRLRLAK